MRRWSLLLTLALGAGLVLPESGGASARSLQAVANSGALVLCAHPNALPYASRQGEQSGLQIEIAEALAKHLGVSLERNWVLTSYQFRRAGCDIVLDAIGDRAAMSDTGLKPSRPYQRSGVTLAVRGDSSVAGLGDLGKTQRVGVQVGSIVSDEARQGRGRHLAVHL